MCEYICGVNRRGGGVLLKKHKNQPLKFLFDWLCFSIRRFQKNVCFAKTGEGVVGMGVANAIYKTGGFFFNQSNARFQSQFGSKHMVEEIMYSKRVCNRQKSAIKRNVCHLPRIILQTSSISIQYDFILSYVIS